MSLSTPAACPLTPRQLEILTLAAEGLTSQQIAQRLRISWSAARSHANAAYKQLGVSTSSLAIIACARAGWIDIGGEASNEAGQVFKLENQLFKLEKLLARIASAIETRHLKSLTRVQRRYLDAFDEHLHARQPTAIRVTADRMEVAFGEVCREAGISIEREHVPRYRATAKKGL